MAVRSACLGRYRLRWILCCPGTWAPVRGSTAICSATPRLGSARPSCRCGSIARQVSRCTISDGLNRADLAGPGRKRGGTVRSRQQKTAPPRQRCRSAPKTASCGRQHPFGGFEFGELVGQLLPFRIDPRQPLGKALPFRRYVVSYSHRVFPRFLFAALICWCISSEARLYQGNERGRSQSFETRALGCVSATPWKPETQYSGHARCRPYAVVKGPASGTQIFGPTSLASAHWSRSTTKASACIEGLKGRAPLQPQAPPQDDRRRLESVTTGG